MLESVLACRLLEYDSSYSTALARVRSYLAAAHDRVGLTPIDQVLLGRPDGEVLAGFDHHTAPRKQVLVGAILHAAGVGGTVASAAPAAPAITTSALHTWKRVEWVACQAIHAQVAGARMADDPLQALADWLDGPRIHEGNHLSHLLVLHALRPYPEHHAAVRHGLDLLVATQCADGGFSVAEHFDTWVTSIVATALTEAGARNQVLVHTGEWMAACQAADGGWSYAPGATQTDMDTTYTAMTFLHAHDRDRYAPRLAAGRAYVRRMQNTDGGWPTYCHGTPSEPAMTGGALVVLAEQAQDHAEEIVAGVRWLAHSQQSDGTFERSWSLAEGNALFRAVHGLCAARDNVPLPPSVARAVDHAVGRATSYLTQTQNHDGGWGHRAWNPSDPISTGYALAALGRLRQRSPMPAAMAFLAACQRPDGGFDAPADTVAPRPIPVDVPVLAPAYVLRGLEHCRQ
ncbi:prenyltransferase/squalene oxidase repeat-containing protein [Nocardia sp. NPDC050408]|uniref:prenyltransferase/squalene oxidase repeat-containing protein n=1 Tax=Nocardia sp. NPDC050408 TaxID=3364319 RepID=UPI00378971C1